MSTGQQPSLFIENCSRFDVAVGNHIDPRNRDTVLIQITDVDNTFVTPAALEYFKHIYQFTFEDTEDIFDVDCITRTQAESIANILKQAMKERCNVVVHCEAGLCRSGAIVEAGEKLGFIPVEKLRIPNVLVRRMVLDCLFVKD